MAERNNKIAAAKAKLSRSLFVERSITSMQRSRANGRRDWKNATDEQIKAIAERMARNYHE